MNSCSLGVSVLICSYNGAKYMASTLVHVAAQQTDTRTAWEVIVVDNASTDNTADVTRDAWKRTGSRVPFRLLTEPNPGKNNAIDTGISAALYAYVLICDDDNWLDKKYVQTAFEIMQSQPSIGMLGGRGIPVADENLPGWFEKYRRQYAVGEQNPHAGELVTSKGFLWGAGSVIHKRAYAALQAAGFERIITYKRFPKIARGEDVELCLAIKLAGYQLWYDDRLTFQHFISSDKLRWSYLTNLMWVGALMSPILEIYKLVDTYPAADESSLIRQYGWPRCAIHRIRQRKYIANVMRLPFTDKREGSELYMQRLSHVAILWSNITVGNQYNVFLKKTLSLRHRLKNVIHQNE